MNLVRCILRRLSGTLLGALSLGVLLLLSCNALNRPANPAARFGVARDEALFLVGGQPRTLDPALTYGGPDGALGHIFSGLVMLDQQLQVQPDLAAGWEVSDDGRVYTFYLHPHAVFHDGRPVTADDVIFSWERAANPATGSDTAATYLNDIVGFTAFHQGEAAQISGLRALDEHTLEVTIDAPKVYFLAKLAYPVTFIVDREVLARPDWERQPNGTGPYRLRAWEDDEILVLERHEAYYNTPPAVPHIVYLLGAGLPLAMYENGQIDLVGIGGSTLERARDPNDPLSADLVTGVSMCTSYVGYNTQLAPFDNPLVRQAFTQAIDRERLVRTLSQGNALVAEGILPPGMPGYLPRATQYPFDPAAAREKLAAAGYTPETLPPITYTTAGYDELDAWSTALLTMWRENLGVEIRPVLVDPFTYQDELFAGRVGHLWDYGWCADYPDPQNFLDVLFHSQAQQNIGGFGSAGVDALLEAARIEEDATARLGLYQEAETALIAEAPALFLSHSLTAALVKPYVQGYVLTPIGIPQWHRVQLSR